jgi:transposase
VALAVFASAIGAAPARADLKCDSERVSAFGGKITAKQIRTTRVGCRPAKRFLRRYFRLVLATSQTEGGCAQRRLTQGCRVRSWRCTVSFNLVESQLRGRCASRGINGKRLIRFDEFDRGPG